MDIKVINSILESLLASDLGIKAALEKDASHWRELDQARIRIQEARHWLIEAKGALLESQRGG